MEELKKFSNLDIMKRKMGILVAAKLRKENKIREAAEIQDNLSRKSGLWSGEGEIRKWREPLSPFTNLT